MTERLRRIRFENFRGLASTEVKLNGKSLVVLGTNGKGKSAIVDGIEFLFSGKVGRFIGAGTGSINHDEAIQHVAKRGTPKVEISLSPSNVSINRDLGESPVLSDGGAVANDFLESHPEVDAFILRRGRILDFVSDQDANRYQKFVKLLGISEIDGMQRTFSDAERSAGEARQRAESSLATKLAVFRDPIDAFGPSSSGEVLAVIASKALALSAGTVGQWADIDPILLALKARRPEAHGELLERITRGVVCLENPLPNDIADDVTSVNQARTRMIALGDSLADAPRMKLLAEATKYLAGHGEESNCPICERGFEHSTAEVLARLRRRSEALTELAELTDRRKAALRRILSFCEGSCAQAVKDLVHRDFFDPVSIDALEIARELAKASADALRQFSATSLAEEVSLPRELTELGALRKALLLKLSTQRSALIPSETAELEAAIAVLERGRVGNRELQESESVLSDSQRLASQASLVREAFSTARESAIQAVFNRIAATVLDFYRRLHDSNGTGDKSECSGLELRSTSRAAAGGLRLAIQFLGATDSKDPRAFLSEGHLDSLGLCVFLATVKIFNRPGTLLVLDDVMTSIDRDHRRRVGELLFQEFSDFQIVITTHDEHWRDLIRSSADAWGILSKWSFLSFEGWTVDAGPQVSVVASSWEFIDAHLNESDYRQLGGPFRLVFESFLKRCAEKLEVKVRFQMSPRYTAADFVFAGIANVLRDKLILACPGDDVSIRTLLGRVFGQVELLNFLSHDNPGRLEITLDQAIDFVGGLRELIKRCETHKLMKGQGS